MTITTLNLHRLLGLAAAASTLALGAHASTAVAKTIAVSERADLRLSRRDGNTLYERGTARGSIAGPVMAVFNVGITRVTGTLTAYSGRSTITFTFTGTPTSTRGARVAFKGSMTVVGGTRRYANARGRASFTGTVNRRTWAATVNANGRLSY